ncbi:hypothetical protein EPUS_03957 [Endocarpon pusillum Z07020]|uniref:Uncharacterized protein n=1 Tax=Endocarpon pusillum (strain Z07020 / HMAS-L-300199) TaxID=1263415 RepID=U1HYD9_ENDPU|nr:uncharacterized protein EPUS_03957 [Endocarpon pusillum Z07020]ERF74519.1 hypothetical protein EPUS_03957 [Endocarpon pusillum Z07020]
MSTTCTALNFRQGPLLNDSELDAWLMQRGPFEHPGAPGNGEKPSGGFRLLLCERPWQSPPALQMSYASFERVEEVFDLSPATLPSLFKYAGVHYRSYKRHAHSNKVESLKMIVKATQKVEISDALLSLSHTFDTQWTTAILCGRGFVVRQNIDDSYGLRLDHILALTESFTEYWTHPLFLPAALLQNLCHRTGISTGLLNERLIDLENDIGVTFAGKAGHGRSLEKWPADIDIKSATIGLHSTNLAKEIEVVSPALSRTSMELSEYLAYELCSMSNTARFVRGYKERVQAQINVLFSAVSQRDNANALEYNRFANKQNEIGQAQNELSIKIASSTKKDSIAVMAFTFITAIFLPGTSIATLFSTGMFHWQDDTSRLGRSTVSSQFWLYWVITVPLTLAVMTGWFCWYKYADRKRKKETGIE